MKCELIDFMGDDLRVVNAARVSFDKESDWEDVGRGMVEEQPLKLSDKDTKLIKYLATHNHWTPFAHVHITMRETVPIFVARQRFKHTVGFEYNEISRRYVDTTPEFYYPDFFRKRAENKKQGSSDEKHQDSEYFKDYLEFVTLHALDCYNAMIEDGVAPEQARMVLPQSMYTSYYVTGSLAAWARAYKLRIDEHAQKEIADLAKMWYNILYGIDELKVSVTTLLGELK